MQPEVVSSSSSSDLPLSRRSSEELLDQTCSGDLEALRELLLRHGERLARVARIRAGRAGARVPLGRLWMGVEQRWTALRAEEVPRQPTAFLDSLARLAQQELQELEGGSCSAVEAADALQADPQPVPVPKRRPSDTELELFPRPDQGLLQERALRRMIDERMRDLPEVQCELVLRIDYCNMSFSDASQELNLGLDEAYQLHRQAWEQLRRWLRERLNDVL